MKQLNFYTLEERPLNDGDCIFYVETGGYYSSYNILYGKVEIEWDEIDEDGKLTGNCFFYEEGVDPPPHVRVSFSVNNFRINPKEFLYVPADEADKVLFGES